MEENGRDIASLVMAHDPSWAEAHEKRVTHEISW